MVDEDDLLEFVEDALRALGLGFIAQLESLLEQEGVVVLAEVIDEDQQLLPGLVVERVHLRQIFADPGLVQLQQLLHCSILGESLAHRRSDVRVRELVAQREEVREGVQTVLGKADASLSLAPESYR